MQKTSSHIVLMSKSVTTVRVCLRQLHTSAANSKAPVVSVLRGIDLKSILNEEPKEKSKVPKTYSLPKAKIGKIRSPITGPYLNNKYQDQKRYPKPTQAEISHSNHVFNIAKKKLNWLIYKYEDIPGEKERVEREKQFGETEEILEEDISEATPSELDDIDSDETLSSENEQNRLAKISKKQEILAEKNSLPEILFVGRCNVGKSSLINGLFNDLSKKIPLFTYAKVKNFPGLTPSLNFYNVGGLLRVVDSPGYGLKGKPWQGDLILSYIQNRRNMRKVYILISFKDGVKETDEQIIDFLVQNRIPFDFIVTKIDKLVQKLSRDQYMHRVEEFILPYTQINNPVLQPNVHFVNSVESKVSGETGLEEVRVDLLKSCGYENLSKLKPLFEVNPLELTQKSALKVGDMDEKYQQSKKEPKKELPLRKNYLLRRQLKKERSLNSKRQMYALRGKNDKRKRK